MRYRSKPSEIEAIRWLGANRYAVEEFAGTRVAFSRADCGRCLLLAGPGGKNGWVNVPKGTWVVRDVETGDDYWPLDHQRMKSKYEPLEES